MGISVLRCDDRLIHGQCIVKVLNDFHIDRILLIDEFTASNPVINSVYKMAVPPNVALLILDPDASYDEISKAIHDKLNTLILVKAPEVALKIFKNSEGLKKEFNIGPMSNRRGTIKATYFSNLLKEEIESIEKIEALGVRVYFQQVPDEKAIEWSSIREKMLTNIKQ